MLSASVAMILLLSYPNTSVDMKRKKVYIQAAEQISIQEPLSEHWIEEPLFYKERLVKAINPPFREYIAPNEARRMGNIMKRALVTAMKVLKETGIEHPDAIITGTSIGSLEYTEKFLGAMLASHEEALSPTFFIQSTQNTVGSALGIHTKSHGYNITYSHGSISFELAMQDAWMQLQLGKIKNALVGGHDEMVESYFELLKKTEYVGLDNMVPCGEVAVSMMLNTQPSDSDLCELVGLRIFHDPKLISIEHILSSMLNDASMQYEDISAIMTGVNGNPANDQYYDTVINKLFPNIPVIHYKYLFGENYTASALGVYAAANYLKHNLIEGSDAKIYNKSPKSILLLNHMNGTEYSMVLLRSCC